MTIAIEVQEHPQAADLRQLVDGVRAYNLEQTQNQRPRPVAVFLRDDTGGIVGGVQGDLWGCSMHIAALWVDDKFRGQGHGSTLMTTIEKYGVENGHPLVYLETTSFQALPFYQSLGYELFGELPEISPGHKLYFLKKELGELIH